jgi:hypothetical protein
MTSTRYKPLVQLGAVLLMVPVLGGAATDNRSYVAGRFAVEISEIGTTYLKSFEGGDAVQAPVTRGSRADKYPDKSPGAVRYEDATVEFQMPLPRGLWDWANAFSSPGQVPARTLTVFTYDANYTEKSRRIFENSVISLVELPALNGGSKDPGYVKMSFAIGRAKENTGTAGGKAPQSADKASSKVMLPSNFRLTIDGLATNRVSQIDPISIKHSPKGLPEYSNLGITFAEIDSESWKAWAAQSVDGKPVEKNGRLELLAPNLKDVLLSVSLEGLGVVRLFSPKSETNSDQIQRRKAELYVEKITFSAPSG